MVLTPLLRFVFERLIVTRVAMSSFTAFYFGGAQSKGFATLRNVP